MGEMEQLGQRDKSVAKALAKTVAWRWPWQQRTALLVVRTAVATTTVALLAESCDGMS